MPVPNHSKPASHIYIYIYIYICVHATHLPPADKPESPPPVSMRRRGVRIMAHMAIISIVNICVTIIIMAWHCVICAAAIQLCKAWCSRMRMISEGLSTPALLCEATWSRCFDIHELFSRLEQPPHVHHCAPLRQPSRRTLLCIIICITNICMYLLVVRD